MKLFTAFLSLFISALAFGQDLERVASLKGEWKFSIGNNMDWADPDYNDSDWEEIYAPGNWENEGFNGYDGYAWYRTSVDGGIFEKNKDFYLMAGYIDDVDRVYFNGTLIGKSGNFPPGYRTAFRAKREYLIPNELIRSGENVIAIQVFDQHGEGGIVSGRIGIYSSERYDFEVDLRGIWKLRSGDNRDWKDPYHDDSNWKLVNVPSPWEKQGFPGVDGTAWYRKEFHLTADQAKQDWVIVLGRIDDFDKSYVNGEFIGATADFKGFGRSTSFSEIRAYDVSASILRNGMNSVAIRVEDIGNVGGIYDGPIGLVLKSEFDPSNLPKFDFWDYKFPK